MFFFFDADKADLMSQLVPYEVPYLNWGLDDTELDTMYADNFFTKSGNPMVSFYKKKQNIETKIKQLVWLFGLDFRISL